jgi:molybdenum cofactor cytidylyltransferase
MQHKDNNYGIVILAAGASSRLGRPKQLLPYNNYSLLQHALEAALASAAGCPVLVLGAYAPAIKQELDTTNIPVVINEQWAEGMASSIRAGLAYLLQQHTSLQSVVLMVCDQPYTSRTVIDDLMAAYRDTGKSIIACAYGATVGTPVLFDRKFFPDLLQLQGDTGAKKLVLQHPEELITVPFPGGITDIDTAADYETLQTQFDRNDY